VDLGEVLRLVEETHYLSNRYFSRDFSRESHLRNISLCLPNPLCVGAESALLAASALLWRDGLQRMNPNLQRPTAFLPASLSVRSWSGSGVREYAAPFFQDTGRTLSL